MLHELQPCSQLVARRKLVASIDCSEATLRTTSRVCGVRRKMNVFRQYEITVGEVCVRASINCMAHNAAKENAKASYRFE